MVLIAIWPVQKSENAVHLTGHKDSGTKQILRGKWHPAWTGFDGSKFRDLSAGTYGMYADAGQSDPYVVTMLRRRHKKLYVLEIELREFSKFGSYMSLKSVNEPWDLSSFSINIQF